MEEFVFAGGWCDAYETRLERRYATFRVALNLLVQFGGSRIVETGSLRVPGDWLGAGSSTLLFAEFVARQGGHLWTCDIDDGVIATAQAATAEYAARITYVWRDSVEFLTEFAGPIDLLYLDSWDCPPDGDASFAQAHNLRELTAAMPHLGPRSLVLIDDNRFDNGGKSRRSKAYLAAAGWLCLLDAYQSLWLCPDRTTTPFPPPGDAG